MAEKLDYNEALRDPAAHFADPAALVDTQELTAEQKIALLRQWEYDESEMAVATEEGMPGGDNSVLQAITAALAVLDPGGQSTAPSKQRVPPTP
jgi:hypothetical protein